MSANVRGAVKRVTVQILDWGKEMQVNKGVCPQRWSTTLGLFAVLFVSSLISGCIGLAGSNNTKLTDSTPAASTVSATSAAITWTTNIASSSQVVYGPTTAYGQSTPLDNTMVTSHSVTIANLTTGVQYHYKCQSQAADGSTSTTADQTFTAGASGDSDPPAVAMTSPVNGATVSGTVTMAASATASAGVANVQFQLDGNNFGAPVTAAPYSIQWDTTSSTNGNHTVAAVATDTTGVSATSTVETITVSNGQTAPPPAVSITSPANNASVSGTITVNVTASDTNGVASVQLQVDGANAGAALTSAPYNFSWDTTTVSNASHTLTAVAKDMSGNAGVSAAVKVTVNNADTTPPTVSITSPANNATVNGTITVNATASDNVGVASVQLQVDGANVGSADTSSPYNFSWSTKSVANGSHTLTAVAKDAAGNATTSAGVKVTVNNNSDTTPPAVSITSPSNNATVSGTITVNATASDNVAVASVQFQVDGANVGSADTTSPYSFSWNTTSVSNGSHTLTAVAKDSSGNTATSTGVKVTVNNTNSTPPAVSISSPSSNATLKATVTVSATASDSDGIASVQFQVDGANVGSADTSSPYNFSWNTTSVSNGSHTLTAVAKSSSGSTATSAGVKVTVNNSDTTPPTVSISSPSNGATVSNTVTVTASASDNVGVASVQFQVDGNNVGSADTSSPYNLSWNTTSYANGSHTLAAVAKDAAGNSAVSSTVNVTVNNASSGSGSGSGIPSTLGWFDVAGQQIAPNCPPDPSNTGSCYGVVDAWNSGIADTNRNILWVWGGGHNDYSGNEIYAFNLNTLKMTRANNPADPTPTCADAFSNGTPSSRHTYGGTAYMPNVDKMYVFGGVPYCPGGGFISDTWTLNLSQVGSSGTGGWTQMDSTLGNGGVHPCNDFGNSQAQYDPNTGLVFVNDSCQGMWTYDPNANSYTLMGAAPSSLSLHEGTVIDPVHKLFLRFGDNGAQSISIASGSNYSVTTLKASGCSGLEGNNPGLQWDPVLQLVVGWPNFGGTLYLYDPVADSCTTQTYSTNAPPDSDMTGSPSTTNGTFKRFGYFPALGVYALVNEWNIDVHTLRLTAGSGSGSGGTGTGSGTTTISNVAASNITTNSATIAWTTSAAATTQVMYGKTANLGSSTTKSSTMTTSHSQTLTGLSANTLYFFSVQSVDGSGNTITGSGFSFGTTNTTDNTPPTVSITAPANGATVSGTVTVSANASDNVAVASVQFMLDGSNLGSADTSSPYATSWNTSGASNGAHTLTATATDTSGNTTTSTGISVTVSNSTSNAEADFQARCATSGVIRCVTFDTTSTISGNAAPGLPLIASGLTTPSIDTSTFASGGGSLHFAVPAGATSANTSGSFNIDFSDDFSQQIDSLVNGDPLSLTTACGGGPCKNEIWIQWRQRFDSGMLQKFANSNGWKQVIVGEGDTASFLSYSCSDLETVVENSNQFEIPRMYHSCGQKLDEYDPLEVNTGRTDSNGNSLFSPQNAAGGYLNCTFTVTINIPTIPPCVPYVANQWMTFQMHIQVGTWYPAGVSSNGGPPAPFKHDSTIQLYVAQEGQPSQLVMDMHPGATSAACDAQQQDIPSCQTGYDLVNPTAYGQADANGNMIREKFGKIWLLPYQTNLNCPSCSAANTWYDELIISYTQIADPKF